MGQAEQQHLDWLARSFGRPDYRPLREDDVEFARRVGESISRPPGTYLFKEGEDSRAAFIVESGEVEISRGSNKGRRMLARVGPGSVLGDLAMFQGGPQIASARTRSSVRALQIARDRLLPELAVHPTVVRWLVAALRHMEETQRRVIRLMHKTVLGQVSELLVEESGSRGEVNLSQSTLATLLGVSRQSVNEALGKLRTDGVITTGYRSIRILDPDRLATGY